jgi:hypothetical protein
MNVLPTHENQQDDASKLAIKAIYMHLCTYGQLPSTAKLKLSDGAKYSLILSTVQPDCYSKLWRQFWNDLIIILSLEDFY